MSETPNEFKLDNAPDDGISSLKFGPNTSQYLLVSSWDSTVRLYDVVSNQMRVKYSHSAPVLDACFQVIFGVLTSTMIILMCTEMKDRNLQTVKVHLQST